MLSANSYLFIFFPTLGLVALAAFYIPAVIFTDLYLYRAMRGRLRFGLGFLVVVGLSIYFAGDLDRTKLRSVWEVSPGALADDMRAGRRCLDGNRVCVAPILEVLHDLREKSLSRMRISPFIRNCSPDPLMERNPERDLVRYCFPAKGLLNSDNCCRVSEALSSRVLELWANPATRSKAADLDRILLPFKAFFIIILVLIGIFLIVWRRTLREHYSAYARPMERGIQIGAIAMLFWPIMDYSYQQTLDVLYGPRDSFPLRLSLVMLPWTVLVTFYFADRIRIELARLGQVVGGLASFIAFFRYQDISDWSSKLAGLAAPGLHFAILTLLSIAILVMLLIWLRGTLRGEDVSETGPGDRGGGDTRPVT
jgi:hypothetical protein